MERQPATAHSWRPRWRRPRPSHSRFAGDPAARDRAERHCARPQRAGTGSTCTPVARGHLRGGDRGLRFLHDVCGSPRAAHPHPRAGGRVDGRRAAGGGTGRWTPGGLKRVIAPNAGTQMSSPGATAPRPCRLRVGIPAKGPRATFLDAPSRTAHPYPRAAGRGDGLRVAGAVNGGQASGCAMRVVPLRAKRALYANPAANSISATSQSEFLGLAQPRTECPESETRALGHRLRRDSRLAASNGGALDRIAPSGWA
jgi:hypothetical protein